MVRIGTALTLQQRRATRKREIGLIVYGAVGGS
jgi:hypothetical protein